MPTSVPLIPIPNIATAKFKGTRTGMVSRLWADRVGEKFTVSEFGRIKTSSGGYVDRPVIQAAVDAAVANGGGTVYFPANEYAIDGAITFPGGDDSALTLLGDGDASRILMKSGVSDYVFHIDHSSANAPHRPVSRIQGLQIINHNALTGGTVLTTAERTGSPGAYAGMGGIYNGSAAPCFVVENCTFELGDGIGIFSVAPMTHLQSTFVRGGYNSLAPPEPFNGIGVMGTSISLGDTRVLGFACGINLFGDSCYVKKINMETCGAGTIVGENLVSYWEPNDSSGAGNIRTAGLNTLQHGYIANMTLESETPWHGFKITSAECLTCDGLSSAHFHVPPDYNFCKYSLFVGSARLCTIKNSDFTGALGVAAIAIGQTDTTGIGYSGPFTGGNITFENVQATNNGGNGVGWLLPPGSWYGASSLHNDPVIFRNCRTTVDTVNQAFDGGVTFANLPPSPSSTMVIGVVCTDSPDPAYVGTTGPSNVGKAITTGSGSNRVRVGWRATTGDWRILG